MPMYPCLNTSTIQPVALSKKLPLISKAGFRHVELWNDEIDLHLSVTGESILDVRKRIQDNGLTVCSVIAAMGWAEAPEAEVDQVFDECKRRCDQAAQVGSKWIVASPPMGHVAVNVITDRLVKLLEITEQSHIQPMLEFLGFTEQYHSVGSVLEVLQSPALASTPIVADIYHLIRGGGALEDLLKFKPGQLGIFHINDLPAEPDFLVQTDYDRVMLGEGLIDLKHAIGLLKEIQFEGPVSLELFNKKLWQADPSDVLRFGFERLSALIA